MEKISKLMVANRGEIAIRIMRAASELKLRTVSIYTHEDRYSLHRYKSDESYQIGKNTEPLKPYLDIEEIIQVAKKQNVDQPGIPHRSAHSVYHAVQQLYNRRRKIL